MVGIGSKRDSHPFLPRQLEKRNPQVLPAGIAVYLDRFVEPRRYRENSAPIAVETFPVVIDPGLGMPEDLNVGIPQGRNVSGRFDLPFA